ncbi:MULTISPECIES: alanine racemase [unclassified Sedimentibacter]|uniref:alanine racemase n=1 Tax=unclassified Sedimentibacter TaxID=2649220 RepID=UPI0027DF8645|nr:alanine racemase [Sedimentibacter sp. MB35-C1]WMJ75945.1 alanine racemase [Sedimentibacter sp. MB35-C1]
MILRDTVVEVNLDKIKYNMKLIKEMCGNDVAVMPVIKADGYGHGAVGIAKTLMESGASHLAVATLVEAIELRKAYEYYPIMILGHTPNRLLGEIVKYNLIPTIFSSEQAKILSDIAASSHKKVKIHIKVDTGFHRLGIYDEDEIASICSYPNIEAEGIFSHLALVNDEENKMQFGKFTDMINKLEKRGITFRYKHISDSISLVDYPEYRMNMVRPGALIYGLRGFHKGFIGVETCICFKTRISQIHDIKKGEGVGYDYLWRATKDTKIGTLPFGYADGYPRNMRDKGYVTIKGIKCPILGVICMDQCMVDLAGVSDPQVGDEAIIYGDGKNNTMSIQEASELAGTNKNEIVARILPRPPRVYVSSEKK